MAASRRNATDRLKSQPKADIRYSQNLDQKHSMTYRSRELIVAIAVSVVWGAVATLLITILTASVQSTGSEGANLNLHGPQAVWYFIRTGQTEPYLRELVQPYFLVSATIFVGCLLFKIGVRKGEKDPIQYDVDNEHED